jgi:hypothetical protein
MIFDQIAAGFADRVGLCGENEHGMRAVADEFGQPVHVVTVWVRLVLPARTEITDYVE